MFAMRRLAVAVAATLVLSACSDSTGPDTVNTQVMATELAQLSTTFENNAAYQSMASLLGYFPGASFAPALRATMPIAPFSVLRGRDGGPALVAPRPELAPGEAQLVIPLDIRGKTYVFNPDSGHYVVSAAAGAPAAGIRIILYVVDLNTGQLLQPLQELGSVDLVDESNNTSDRLHVTLRLASTTISDYTITAVPGANSLRLTCSVPVALRR